MSRKTINFFIFMFLLIMAYGIFWPLLHGKNPIKFGLDLSGGVVVEYAPDFSQTLEAYKAKSEQELLELAKAILQSRLYTKLKITPDVVIRGDKTILVSIPSVENPNKILTTVGQTFNLSFRLVRKALREPPKHERFFVYGNQFLLLGPPVFSGDMLELDKIKVSFNSMNEAQVNIAFKPEFAKKWDDFTQRNVGKRLAILVDKNVQMAPIIEAAMTGGESVISGGYTDEEAHNTAMLLRSGAIPISLHMESIRMVGPSLGQKVKESGTIALLLSLIAILIILLISYLQRVWLLFAGLLSICCLLFSIFGLVSLLEFTLDISAIAGAILTMGMGIDAFIIIFESLEIKLRKFQPREIAAYYETVIKHIYSFSGDGRILLHSNLTTLLAILPILYVERLKHLAMFIIAGIVASLFTVVFTRETLQATHILSPKKTISMIGWIRNKETGIFNLRKIFLSISGIACLVSVGIIFMSLLGKPLIKFGPEFHPGTQITVRLDKQRSIESVIDVLKADHPQTSISFQQVVSLSKSRATLPYQDYLISINKSLHVVHSSHKPTEEQPSLTDEAVISDQDDNLYEILPPSLLKLDTLQAVFEKLSVKIINIDSISSRLSSRNIMKSLTVLLVSFGLIAIYLLFIQTGIDRYFLSSMHRRISNEADADEIAKVLGKPESTYTISLGIVVAVIHDILIMMLFCWILKIDITLPVIAAVLTMIGYSVNDSVVLWAHIQNTYEKLRNNSAVAIVSNGIDSVLSRTILTSLTTLVPTFTVLIAGITELKEFALIIIVGVVAGTLSSIFIVGSFAVVSLGTHAASPEKQPRGSEPNMDDRDIIKRLDQI